MDNMGKGIEMEAPERARLSEVAIEDVTMLEMVNFARNLKRFSPLLANVFANELNGLKQGTTINNYQESPKQDVIKEYIVMVQESPCNFTAPMALSIGPAGVDFSFLKMQDIKVAKQCVDQLLEKQVDIDNILLLSIEPLSQLRNIK